MIHKCSKWCLIHKRVSVSSLLAVGVGGSLFSLLGLGTGWFALWVFAIIVPVILGMMDYIDFKWVILWECIMFLPIGVIIFLIFGGTIISLLRKS